MKVKIYLNGYYVATTKVNEATVIELQNCGFVLEMVKEDK